MQGVDPKNTIDIDAFFKIVEAQMEDHSASQALSEINVWRVENPDLFPSEDQEGYPWWANSLLNEIYLSYCSKNSLPYNQKIFSLVNIVHNAIINGEAANVDSLEIRTLIDENGFGAIKGVK